MSKLNILVKLAAAAGVALLPAIANAQEQDLCRAIVDAARQASPTSAIPGAILDKGWTGTREEVRARLTDEWHASGPLLESLAGPAPFATVIHRLGGSDLHYREFVAGSAGCQNIQFFEAKAGAPARAVDGPFGPIAEGNGLCGWSTGYAAEIAGVPAFVIKDDHDNIVDLTVVPWEDGAWQKPCGVSLHFANTFEVTERFCASGTCDAFADRALALAKTHDEETTWGASGLTAALNAEAGVEPDLPTFGHGAEGQHPVFGYDTLFTPVLVDGERLLARIGHPVAIGSHLLRDYIVAFYRLADNKLTPVAGLYIEKSRAGLKTAIETRPRWSR
jgi:hypothetical protein